MPTWVPSTVIAKAVFAAGFEYDGEQDIIYSRMDAWQRKVGYCWTYDVGAPGLGFIIDCEPICFTYDGATWMIELWKGQYGIETGAEIGVYRTGEGVVSTVVDYLKTGGKIGSIVYETGKRVAAGLAYRANWYRCADDFDTKKLELSFALKRKGEILLMRDSESHWWLTGFKWGEFTEKTSDLTLDVSIRFKNEPKMQYAFTDALWKMGYQPQKWDQNVCFEFKNPKTPQPSSRSWLESKAQLANKIMVTSYNDLKAELGLEKNDPNDFKVPDAIAYKIFAHYFKKIWRR